MILRQRLLLSTIGGSVGLLFGLLWYFTWGCDRCVQGSSPLTPIVFVTLCGVIMANLWGKEHLQNRSY